MKILSLFTNENRNEHDKICKAIISTEKIYQKFLFALLNCKNISHRKEKVEKEREILYKNNFPYNVQSHCEIHCQSIVLKT